MGCGGCREYCWVSEYCHSLTPKNDLSNTHTCRQTDADTHSVSPHDEIKLWPCQHENAQQRGDRSVNHRGKHVLQSHCRALVSVANRCQEALRRRRGRWRGEMSWKSCRSHKTCACGEAWHASEFLHLVLLGISTLHKLPSKSLIMLILPLSLSISGIKPQEYALCTDFKTTKCSKMQLTDFNLRYI